MLNSKYILSVLLFQFVILTGCGQNGETNEYSKNSKDQNSELNDLADAKSPYLRQHADNPVNWHEWGAEALEKAKKENKPLLISIGYAACHWCHVMEHESFMDSTVAKIMNEHFVPIKIDREERPDIDQIYMNAVQLLSGRGGWPLNAFALPNGQPYYAGTYFSKDQWIKVLNQMNDVYRNDYEKVQQQAIQLTKGIQSQEIITVAGDSTAEFLKNSYKTLFQNWLSRIDFKKGGYDKAPKFPLPTGWEFLLQYHYLTGKDKALEAVVTTLDEMAKGGIYDQIGGGFARYSTDADWFAPHFEKMLYDNGQLISLYAHAYKLTKDETYAEVIRETLEFIKREMTSSQGGFYSSLNADSEGEEGKFYVWTSSEIDQVLDGKTAELVKDYYGVKNRGNWEHGNNILYRESEKMEFAENNDMSLQEWDKMLKSAKKKLLKARSKRERPSTDDKVLTSWNALMLKGYVDAYLALGDEAYLKTALKNAHFLEANMMRKNGRLWRNYNPASRKGWDGEAGIEAFLDDYALLADAYIHLYQATFDKHWLDLAKKLTDYSIAHFQDPKSGMFYYTSDQSEKLIARKMEITDNVIPASNSLMAHVLYKMGEYYYHKPYIQMSKTMLNHVVDDIPEAGPYYANWASLLGLMAYEPYEIAIMGDAAQNKNLAMQSHYLPTAIFMGGAEENLSLLKNKLVKDETIIYVCKNKVCKLPVQQVEDALKQIEKWK